MDGDNNRALVKPQDLCAMTPLRRQQVKDTWRSEPRSYELPPLLTPRLVRKTPFGLSVPALKAKCSPHTELLAVPRIQVPQMHYTTKAERELQKELEEEMTKEELKWLYRKVILPTPTGVRKAALTAKITPRVETMALARLAKAEELSGASQKRKKKQRSVPSHFPLSGKSQKKKSETRVCGCAESIKRIHFGIRDSVKS